MSHLSWQGGQLDAVVWTNLGPKWNKEEGRVPSVTEVMDYIRSQGQDSKAAEYVRKTPTQIDTEYRRRIVTEIDWLKPRAG